MAEGIYLTLEEVVGKSLSHLTIEKTSFSHQGLRIVCWKYENSAFSALNNPPVIAIHGGPGFTHNYMLPLMLLADEGYPVIFYDQAGCGESKCAETEVERPELLTIDYYLNELRNLIAHFNCSHYYLYGSSWGTIIAQEFAVLQPGGLLGIILDGALHDAQQYIRSQWKDRISTLPTVTQKILKTITEQRQFDHPRYQLMNDVLSKHFTCRLVPPGENKNIITIIIVFLI